MKRFRIIETNVYELDAETDEQAEKEFLDADQATRDALYFVEISDREVYEITQ